MGTKVETTPVSVTLHVRLTGPFPTPDALKAAVSSNALPPGTRTVEAVAVSVTDRSGGAPMSELSLPADLPAGFYNLETEESSAGNASKASTIIVVQR